MNCFAALNTAKVLLGDQDSPGLVANVDKDIITTCKYVNRRTSSLTSEWVRLAVERAEGDALSSIGHL